MKNRMLITSAIVVLMAAPAYAQLGSTTPSVNTSIANTVNSQSSANTSTPTTSMSAAPGIDADADVAVDANMGIGIGTVNKTNIPEQVRTTTRPTTPVATPAKKPTASGKTTRMMRATTAKPDMAGISASSSAEAGAYAKNTVVKDSRGATIGSIDSVISGADGMSDYVIVKMGNERVRVPSTALNAEGRYAVSTMSKAEIRAMANGVPMDQSGQ